MAIRSNSPSARHTTTVLAAAVLAVASLSLAGCQGGAQTEYPERTESGTPVAPNDEVTPDPEPTPSTTPSPVPTTVDESGTLDG